MKVTFYSNYLNHHQLPFCKTMYEKLGNSFKFVATTPIPYFRLQLGYDDLNKKYPFVITTYDTKLNQDIAMKLCEESDVIITGSAPEVYNIKRIDNDKILFKYSERVYKRGVWKVISPRGIFNIMKYHTKYRHKKVYMLCASGYTAGDFSMLGAYKHKTYKWGYFPEKVEYKANELIQIKSNKKINILWCGRFLEWKHPEKAIHVAKKLRAEGYDFILNMIGTGELLKQIKSKIGSEDLRDYIKLLGAMPNHKVRQYMRESNIFLFTSDYNEGWGAVLNEAMNSGCAVVASHAIGSVPFLIENKKNGLIYKNNNEQDLYSKVKLLMDNETLREDLSKEAYNTINNTWNGENAAERFIDLADSLINNRKINIEEGPCSKATPIYQWNMLKNCSRTAEKI